MLPRRFLHVAWLAAALLLLSAPAVHAQIMQRVTPPGLERVRDRIAAIRMGPMAAAPADDRARRTSARFEDRLDAIIAEVLADAVEPQVVQGRTVYVLDPRVVAVPVPRRDTVRTPPDTVRAAPDPGRRLAPDTVRVATAPDTVAADTVAAGPATPDTVQARGPSAAEIKRSLLNAGVFRTAEVNFETGASTLQPRATRTLDAVGTVLARVPDLRVEVGGHTDAQGAEAFNRRLSQARAEAVRDYLLDRFDVAPSQLVARGYGEARPVASNETATGRALNRRVEFTVLSGASDAGRDTTARPDSLHPDSLRPGDAR